MIGLKARLNATGLGARWWTDIGLSAVAGCISVKWHFSIQWESYQMSQLGLKVRSRLGEI